MHTAETKDKFIELRAAGQSFGQIAEQLRVAKSTLHAWQDEFADDILRLRRIHWEENEAECDERIEDQLNDLIGTMKDCKHRLNQFTLGHYSLRDAWAILRQSRREYFRLRPLLMGTGHRHPEPAKTERSPQNRTTQPRSTNELQQSKPESFDFVGRDPDASGSPSASPTPDPRPSTQDSPPTIATAVAANGPQLMEEHADALPLPRGEGQTRIGQSHT